MIGVVQFWMHTFLKSIMCNITKSLTMKCLKCYTMQQYFSHGGAVINLGAT